jgi:hypothetical protein
MKNKLILSCLVAILGAFSVNAAPKFQNVHLIKNADGSFANQAIGAKVTLIKNSQRWTADTVYIIDRLTFVEAPAVLTIEPGTIVRMEQKTTGGTSVTDPADVGTLIICRGAKIVANGTAESPIIITNIDDPFVPGGEITIPNKDNGVTDNSTYAPYDTQTSANNGYTRRDYAGNSRFNYDATCGGLIILGKTPVAFGAPAANGGGLQLLIDNAGEGYEFAAPNVDPTSSSYGKYSLTLGAVTQPAPGVGTAAEATLLFDQHGSIKRVFVQNGGVYNDSTAPELNFAGADIDSRLISLPNSELTKPTYTVNMVPHPTLANKYTIGSVLTGTTTRDAQNNPIKYPKGYGYQMCSLSVVGSPANQESAPNLKAIVGRSMIQALLTKSGSGYTGEFAVTMPNQQSTAYAATQASGSTTVTLPVDLTGITKAAVTTAAAIRGKGVTGSYSDPVVSPIQSGIGANFIEGFQTIDGKLLGISQVVNNVTYNFSGSIYGGSDDNDNSGTLRFVSIRYGGFVLSPNNEINGLTCGAVGRGTSFEFIEVVNNADDDIEHFGGSVDMKYVAGLFGGDDGIDIDQGYRGRIQFAFQIQNNTSGTSRPTGNIGDCLGEWDGPEAPTSGRPYTVHTLFNFTGIGTGATASAGKGINYKDNSGGKVFNSIFADAKSGLTLTESGSSGIAQDATGTIAANRFASIRSTGGVENLLGVGSVSAGEPDAMIRYTSFRQVGAATTASDVFLGINTSATWGTDLSSTATTGTASRNDLVNDLLDFRGIARVDTTGGLDPRLTEGSSIRNNGIRANASGGVRANDTFYTQTQLRGAFRDLNWLSGWSLASEWGLLSDANVAIPAVKLTRASGVLTVSFTPTSGVEYVIETSADGKKFTPFTTVTGGSSDVSQALPAGTADSLLFVRVMPL